MSNYIFTFTKDFVVLLFVASNSGKCCSIHFDAKLLDTYKFVIFLHV